MKKTSIFGCVSPVSALVLGGCSVFTPPAAKPIIEDHAQKQINTFAVMPSRRMVIVKNNVNLQGDLAPPSAIDEGLLKDKAIVLCAEASPDVSDDIAASLAAAASGKAPSAGDAKAAEAGISFAQALATTGQSLFKRTQALQFYRDTAYHLCQAKINGFINDAQFLTRLVEAENTAKDLLKAEMPWLYLSQILNDAQKEAIKAAIKQSITVADGKITIDNGKDKVVVSIPGAATEPEQ